MAFEVSGPARLCITMGRGMRYLLSVPRTHCRLDLPKAIAHEKSSINQHSVGRTIDLKVPEEDVGTEKREDLVDTIVRLAFGSDVHVGGIGRQSGQSVGGTASTSTQRQDRKISYWIVRQCEVLGVDLVSVAMGGAPYLSRGHRGPRGRWNDMPEESISQYKRILANT